jgi:hypothetical protein
MASIAVTRITAKNRCHFDWVIENLQMTRYYRVAMLSIATNGAIITTKEQLKDYTLDAPLHQMHLA